MSFFATAFGTKVAITALALVAIGGGAAVAVTSGAVPIVPSSEVATDTQTESDSGDLDETPTATLEETETPTGSVKQGPDATGPSAFGLCTAYTAGGLNSSSVAYSSLLTAAETAGTIADYCAPVLAAHAKDVRNPDDAPDAVSTEKHSNGNGQSGDPHGKSSPDSHGR